EIIFGNARFGQRYPAPGNAGRRASAYRAERPCHRAAAALHAARFPENLHYRCRHEGLPPHIAQVIAGHKDTNVTMGYKAVYPDEAIQSHLAFPARRRAQRPTDEYRVPSDEEWQEFLGHFERRKVATGICGRAFGP